MQKEEHAHPWGRVLSDTIVAEASPKGQAGVAVVRLSGPRALAIAEGLCGETLKIRHAHFVKFKASEGGLIDEGIALFFKGPQSFTGEDVVELQCHGSPIVIDQLLEASLKAGARLARPGEFSERAFLNDKIDLVQAEAIADLIAAGTRQAAQAALRSLEGKFSEKIHALVSHLIHLRTFIEATLDFPDEDIEFIENEKIIASLQAILEECQSLGASAEQGVLLQEGANVVIVGRPNAGKSSLLNALAKEELAIVSDIPGTTRDIVKERIHLHGIPIHILDTAGLRDSTGVVEKEGIRRTKAAAQKADALILLVDVRHPEDLAILRREYLSAMKALPMLTVFNKLDLCKGNPSFARHQGGAGGSDLWISVKTGQGLPELETALLTLIGAEGTSEGHFIARRRHLHALQKAHEALERGLSAYQKNNRLELLAEEARLAQESLSSITGEFRADDLLGVIFSSFCIGK